jgi:predicted O-methyltransferase YrrM
VPKLEILGWYLKRPRYYRQFARQGARAISERLPGAALRYEEGRAAGEKWARSRAITTDDAVERLVSRHGRQSLSDAHRSCLEDGEARAAGVPFYMGGPGNLELLYQLAEGLQATRVLETGVGYGWSTLALLLSLSRRPQSRLVSTDFPYYFPDSERYVGIVVPQDLRGMWTLVQHPDREGLPRAFQLMGQFDLCHYDSDKSYSGRMWGYNALWPRLRPGGFFVSDDIGDNCAFRDFAGAVSQEPIVVIDPEPEGDKFIGVIAKGGLTEHGELSQQTRISGRRWRSPAHVDHGARSRIEPGQSKAVGPSARR